MSALAELTGVHYELEGHVARVTIDRPDVLNAVDARTEAELEQIWQAIERDRRVRVVVLTGAGDRAFSVGADMKARGDATGIEFWLESSPNGFGAIALRATLDVPVIARVNGYALGGGLEMMLGCDIVVAAESARLGLTEPRVGRLPLGGGIPLLVRQIPYRQAMGMLLTGRRISAQEALALGLVNEVVADDDLDAAVGRWLDEILACSPASLRAIKQIVKRTATLDAREVLRVKAREPLHARSVVRGKLPALLEAFDSDDSREGVQAFLEKRAPRWSS